MCDRMSIMGGFATGSLWAEPLVYRALGPKPSLTASCPSDSRQAIHQWQHLHWKGDSTTSVSPRPYIAVARVTRLNPRRTSRLCLELPARRIRSHSPPHLAAVASGVYLNCHWYKGEVGAALLADDIDSQMSAAD